MAVVGPHTIDATEQFGTFDKDHLRLRPPRHVLTMDVVSDVDPVNLRTQMGIYETLPFTRVP